MLSLTDNVDNDIYINSSDMKNKEKKQDIEMGNISQSILDVAAREFRHLFPNDKSSSEENIFEQLKEAQYFPKQLGKELVHTKDFLRLCYLTTLKTDDTKSPFTAEDVAIFRTSMEKAAYTVDWFKKGIVPFLLFSGTTYVSLWTVDQNNYLKTGVVATTGFISTFALQLLSLWITGTNPNSSKDADDRKQNTIHKVKASYDEMAKELIVLNNSQPRFAKALAKRIDMKKIFRAAINSYLEDVEAKTVFKYLKDAILFVKGKREIPRNHELRLYVEKS